MKHFIEILTGTSVPSRFAYFMAGLLVMFSVTKIQDYAIEDRSANDPAISIVETDMNEDSESMNTILAGVINSHKPDGGAKMYSVHKLELRSGVSGSELERFFSDRFFPAWNIPGWSSYLLKADRGEREGSYAVIHEIESMEYRDRYFPQPGESTPEWQEQVGDMDEISAELNELVSVYLGEVYTDYYVVAD